MPEASYFTASKYATMQTSYPLGFPLIIWFLNALTGGIAEHFAQLLPPLFLSFCIGSLVSVINQSKRSFLFFSLLLASSGILIATRLYSEPLMTLFLLAGIDAIIQKKQSGFLLLGMCGWVKTEGLLIAFAAWGALVIMFFPLVHDKQTGWCRNISTLLLTVAPGLCWFGVSRCCGGTPHDYAPLWTPNLFRGIQASKEVLTNIFLTPWHPACYFLPVCLPIVSFVMKNKEDKKRKGTAILFFSVITSCGFVYLISLSLAEDFSWHCQCIERLLFVPALASWRLYLEPYKLIATKY